jgi:hypothetical protein
VGTTAVAHWAGPEPSQPDAAFLALHSPQAGVRSIVALKHGARVYFHRTVRVEGAANPVPVSSLDIEGVMTQGWAILFHSESGLLRSAFSFDTGKREERNLRFLITGVAPGVWEVWRNGWVVDTSVVVRAAEAVLYFEERPGSYFIRRLN